MLHSALLEELYKKEAEESAQQLRVNMWKMREAPEHPYEVFISAPFGNYIKHPNATSVTGTWTLEPRRNLIGSLFKSLRYKSSLGGWTNRLGLPNAGLKTGLEKTGKDEVLSIAETKRGDFKKMVRYIPVEQSIELNLSCPNLDNKNLPWDDAKVFVQDAARRKWCIAKVSPLTKPEELEFLIDGLGFTQIHFSNTLPTVAGGLSGNLLRPYTLDLIRIVREKWGSAAVEIIAGGGVSDFGSVYQYLNSGANHVALGSVCFNWFKMKKILKGEKSG